MSLFGEVAGQRFFLGTQYRWDPIIARTWAGFHPRGLVSSGPEVVAAAATRQFAPLVLLDTFTRAAGKCLVPRAEIQQHASAGASRLDCCRLRIRRRGTVHSCPGRAQRPAASGRPSKAVLYM